MKLRKYTYLILTACLFTICLSDCDLHTQPAPQHTNPFDPDNPETHGDPFKLQAELTDDGVLLTWQALVWHNLSGYSLYRRVDDDELIPHVCVDTSKTSFRDRDIVGIHRYEYAVTGRFGDHDGGLANIRTAVINAVPQILLLNDLPMFVPSRNVALLIYAFGAEWMRLSNYPSFAGAQWEEFRDTPSWLLTTGPGTKTVYMQVIFFNDETSGVYSVSTEPCPMRPSVQIIDANEDRMTKVREVSLKLYATGGIDCQISEDSSFAEVEWQTYEDTVPFELSTGQGQKYVYARFRNDFEIVSSTAVDSISPQPLLPRLSINGGDAFTNDVHVLLNMPEVGAVGMKLGRSKDLSGVGWQPYQPELPAGLADFDGEQHIYAIFRNEFFVSAVVGDEIILDRQASVEQFVWFSENGNPHRAGDRIRFYLKMRDDNLGQETGGSGYVTIPGIADSIELRELDTVEYAGDYYVREGDFLHGGVVGLRFVDRAGNVVEGVAGDSLEVRGEESHYLK